MFCLFLSLLFLSTHPVFWPTAFLFPFVLFVCLFLNHGRFQRKEKMKKIRKPVVIKQFKMKKKKTYVQTKGCF